MVASTVWIRDDLQGLLEGKDIFAFMAGLEGDVFRALEYRKTQAVTLAGQRYFIKVHRGTGLGEILKNLLQLRLPVTGARNEWLALTRLAALGVAVPKVAAYGSRGILPWTCESFILTDDVGARENLEDLTRDWPARPPAFREKLALLREVARISRTLHGNGICHRDFYLCHFLVSGDSDKRLTLIDLHRALVKRRLGRRWIVKDVGSLWFSAMAIGLGKRDLLRFVRWYSATPLKTALQEQGDFWRQVQARAEKLQARHG